MKKIFIATTLLLFTGIATINAQTSKTTPVQSTPRSDKDVQATPRTAPVRKSQVVFRAKPDHSAPVKTTVTPTPDPTTGPSAHQPKPMR